MNHVKYFDIVSMGILDAIKTILYKSFKIVVIITLLKKS
jgi:hypothetical protein